MVKILWVLIALLSFSSCGIVKKFWGESAPVRETVIIKGNALPNFTLIFSHDDREAESVLHTWHESMVSTFSQIEGGQKDYISAAEVKTLVKRGLIVFGENPEHSTTRVLNVMELLGFKDGILKQNVEALFAWLAINRVQARTFYDLAIASDGPNSGLKARDLAALANLFGSFASLTGDQILQPKHMAELIQPFIPDHLPHAKAALQSGIELGVAFFASFCGDRVNRKVWHGNKVGECLHDLTLEFAPYGPLFDFMFGNQNPVAQRVLLKAAAENFPGQVDHWLKDHNHPRFQTQKVKTFSDALGIPAPYAFVRLTEWIPKLNSDSTADAFSPYFFIDLSTIVQTWVLSTLKVTQNEKCMLDDWKACEFKGSFQPADQLFNEEYATLIRTKTLGFVSKIAFYDSIAGFILKKLDTDEDGVISDEIQELINITIRLLDTNAYAQNVVSRIQEKTIDNSNTENSLKSLHRQGLSELAALAADLIPERGKNRRNLLQKLESQILAPDGANAYSLDRLGITSFLYVFDLVANLREEYLNAYQVAVRQAGSLSFVKRRAVVAALPRILSEHFPNVYEECKLWGFERSCGVLFTDVLPNPSPGSDELETYEIDVITLTGILLQSMMNRCDRNGDHLLRSSLVDGFDEKHCMLNVSSVLAKRLMRANIVENDNKANLLLMLVKRVPFVRWAAKTALSQGSTHGIWWKGLPPFNFLSGPATLGSVMALSAELMAGEKVSAIMAEQTGPVDAIGDELVYHHELTLKFSPKSEETAPRRESANE